MTELPKSAESGQEAGLLVEILLGLVLLVVVSLPALMIAASCTPAPRAVGKPVVIDPIGLLDARTVQSIEAIWFPADVPVILRVVDRIPEGTIGTYATDAMRSEALWHELRPRGLLRRIFRLDSPSDTGVYVVLTLEPQLIQIRFGRQLRLGAYRAGLAAGPWYRSHQEFELDKVDTHLVQLLDELASELRKVVDPPLMLSLTDWLASPVISEIEDFLDPPDSVLSSAVMSRYLRFLDTLGGARDPVDLVLGTLLLTTFGILLVRLCLLGLGRLSNPIARTALGSGLLIGLVGFVATSFGAAGLLSRGRIEDEWALSELGLATLSELALPGSSYAAPGGIRLAFPSLLIALVCEALEQVARMRSGDSAHLAIGWILWGVASFFLPSAIGVVLLMILIWNLLSAMLAFLQEG